MKTTRHMGRTRPNLRSERGLATIETLPLLFVFIFLISYMFGAFGIIHTGIMNSISARTYAFETFKNRTSLVYFRDTPGGDAVQFKTTGNRQHGIMTEQGRNEGAVGYQATERPIRIGMTTQPGASSKDIKIHNEKIFDMDSLGPGKRNTKVEVSPAWIMVQYGICLDVNCGG